MAAVARTLTLVVVVVASAVVETCVEGEEVEDTVLLAHAAHAAHATTYCREVQALLDSEYGEKIGKTGELFGLGQSWEKEWLAED